MEGVAAAAAAAEGRHPPKPHPRFNNRNSWKHKLRENCYKRVREDRMRLLWKIRMLPIPQILNHIPNDLIKSAFQDIVSAELEKIKESSLDENVRRSTSVPEANDMLWEYEGLTNVYQGDCEEIMLEMQRIFYEDLTIHPTRKEETEICVETWEDEEDEYLSQAVYEHMHLNDKQAPPSLNSWLRHCLPLESKNEETLETTATATATAASKGTTTATSKGTATPNVTELHQAGVEFKPNVRKGISLFDIKFSSGILGICGKLEIPKLRVDDTTELTLRNLLAFEQCHHREKDYLANYVFLMKRLVKTQTDVQLLVDKGIIDNWLGDTQKVSTLLHDLGTGMIVDNWYYANVCKELIKYREKRWPRWMVILKQEYLNSPWGFFSVTAAVSLLALTIVQTVCSLKSVP